MKKNPNLATGKILNHDNGLGLTDERDVEQRAGEVARIEGHRAISDEDRRQAELELNGDDLPPLAGEDAEGIGALSRDPSEPPSNPGHQVPDQLSEDEQSVSERLVAEGVNEAELDQMLAARKQKKE